MSMFTTLAPYASESPVSLHISAGDEGKLRVYITQKKDAATGIPLELVVTATAEELDNELPLAIAEFMNIPGQSVAEQVKAQKEIADAKADDDKDPPAKAKAAAKKPAAKKAPPPKPAAAAKAAKPTKAERKAERSKAAAAIKTPVIEPLIKPRAPQAAAASEAAPNADQAQPSNAVIPAKAGIQVAQQTTEEKRAACLADLANALTAHGDKLTRRQFAAMATTGRSFERLWGSWEKFRAEIPSESTPAAHAAAQSIADDKTLPLPGLDQPAAEPATTAAAPAEAAPPAPVLPPSAVAPANLAASLV